MKNPFSEMSSYFNNKKKIPSYFNNKKKVPPKDYFNEINKHFNKQITNQLNDINKVVNQAEELKKETKLDNSTIESHIEKLNEKFVKNPTEIGVFKSKNDLAIELNNQILNSKEVKELTTGLKWLLDNSNGSNNVDKAFNMLENYNKAFNNIKKKYRTKEMENSFNANYNELKSRIPEKIEQIHLNKKGSEYKEEVIDELNDNLKNSYYKILNNTPVTIKNPTKEKVNLSGFKEEGTDHPIFEKANRIDTILRPEFKIDGAHQKLAADREKKKKRNKKGVTFSEEVKVKEIPNISELHIYPKSASELKKELSRYKGVERKLRDLRRSYYDERGQEKEDKESTLGNTSNNVDDGKIKTEPLAGVRKKSKSRKAYKNRTVVVHFPDKSKQKKATPEVEKPTLEKFTMPLNKLMPGDGFFSRGTNEDRELLAKVNKEGTELSYPVKNEKTGEISIVKHRSTVSDNPKGIEISNQLKKDRKKGISNERPKIRI